MAISGAKTGTTMLAYHWWYQVVRTALLSSGGWSMRLGRLACGYLNLSRTSAGAAR
jgi:hypothetical protein